MSMRNVFGRLLLNVSVRLKNFASRLGVTDTGKGNTTTDTTKDRVLIWDVIDGPYHRDEFDEDELIAIGVDDNLEYFIVVKLQDGDSVGIVNFWLETDEEAYEIVRHFQNNIEPLEVN
jgi:hypothetical protein